MSDEECERILNQLIDYVAEQVNKRIIKFGENAEEALQKVLTENLHV